MKLGFLTAPFPETPLMEVADWAAGNGFEVLEIACWPQATGPTRRYAGTSHIDVVNLRTSWPRRSAARSRARACRSGLGYYPNPLHPDPATRQQMIDHIKAVIVAAGRMGIPFMNTFMGGDVEVDGRELGRGAAGLARHRQARPGQRRETHDRELPDDLQPERMAGRQQHRLVALHLAPDPRAVGRHDRAQL